MQTLRRAGSNSRRTLFPACVASPLLLDLAINDCAQSPFEVLLTAGAERDLGAIHDYIAEFDSLAHANRVLDELLELVQSLSHSPERGSYPQELLGLGSKEFRQTFFKPYRVIYKVIDRQVIIMLIADGRRDMQNLLERRLLGG